MKLRNRNIKLHRRIGKVIRGGTFMSQSQKNITIADVAEALGISKTTVSRAISGKGRIGEATRQKVLSYIEEHNYKPNVIAKGLAQSRTYNLCVVMPGSFSLVDMPFFKDAMTGIQEIAELEEYDILLCIGQKNNLNSLERVVSNHKVDGVILLRTFLEDTQIELLQNKKVPFVTTGSTRYKKVKQVDFDHESACYELTSILLMRGVKKIALLGGDEQIMANQNRFLGFKKAMEEQGRTVDKELIFANLDGRVQVDRAVDTALSRNVDCILCMDDAVCTEVVGKLRQDKVPVPQKVKVASFHNSSVLADNVPSITSLDFNSKELGMAACKNILAQIEGEEVENKTLLPYEVILKESTK